MRLPGGKKLVAAGRWVRSRFRPRALVLGYHRVGAPRSDPYRLAVSEDVLRAHLEAVRRMARPTRLSDLVRDLGSGTVHPNAVVVTLDDAYSETLHVLRGILHECEIPATVFVPTAYVGREPWWERLQRCLAGARRLPDRLELRADGIYLVRTLDELERSGGVADARSRLIVDIYEAICRLPSGVRDEVLSEIGHWAGGGRVDDEAVCHRVASREELVELARDDFVEIGSHSSSHPFLARLSTEEQRREIESSKQDLEEIVGRRVDLFSYPNGSFDERTLELVRRAGYVGACTSELDVVTASTDPHRLPRHWPTDEGRAVARTLRRWLGPRS